MYKGQLHEIMYAFRQQADTQEWVFCLEERKGLSSAPRDLLGAVVLALGAGSDTPRIVYEIFRDAWHAHTFFADIPANGDRVNVTNKSMMKLAELVSSGEVLPAEPVSETNRLSSKPK